MPNTEAISDPRYLERRFEALEAATGQSAPSYGGAVPTPSPLLTLLPSGAIGTTEVAVAHGLSYIPVIYGIVMTSAGNIQKSTTATDATNIYLKADAAGRTANITLGH